GATLAGAGEGQIKTLFKYGICLGRAFQIKDDIMGMFGSEKKIGKSIFTDLSEAKKTILIWHAYHNSNTINKLAIKEIFSKKAVDKADLLRMRKIIYDSGTLEYAQKEIDALIKESEVLSKTFLMHPRYQKLLNAYSKELLEL
ncbi:MAG: polyprenyl synthetase family protein, partial [Candidatus Omnitrophica bacterium]|nr:polyprenyl synthetase family protein [Candidatus Omnitrophota bacterium]